MKIKIKLERTQSNEKKNSKQVKRKKQHIRTHSQNRVKKDNRKKTYCDFCNENPASTTENFTQHKMIITTTTKTLKKQTIYREREIEKELEQQNQQINEKYELNRVCVA